MSTDFAMYVLLPIAAIPAAVMRYFVTAVWSPVMLATVEVSSVPIQTTLTLPSPLVSPLFPDRPPNISLRRICARLLLIGQVR